MLASAALRFVNHLLAGEPWAQARLKPFAGQTACVEFGKFSLPVTIAPVGMLVSGKRSAEATVTIRLPDDALSRALTDRPSLLASTRISGSAELAETLGFVFRNLRWDAEDDLSLLVGDLAARRLLQGGKSFVQWHVQRARNFALNVVEHLTEEAPMIARRADIGQFCSAVDAVRDDCRRFEQRLQSIESH